MYIITFYRFFSLCIVTTAEAQERAQGMTVEKLYGAVDEQGALPGIQLFMMTLQHLPVPYSHQDTVS